MAETAQSPQPALQFEQISARYTYTPPGCTFGVGIGKGARNDARSVLTVWFLFSWSFGILLLAVIAAIVRRCVLEAAARFYDRRQAHAIDQFRREFPGCSLREAALDEVLPAFLYKLVSDARGALANKERVQVWYVAEVEAGARQPSAFATYFFLRTAPIIVCPSQPLGMSDYQRFILYHEIGHAVGFQTSHSVGRMIAVSDGLLLATWFAIFTPDHTWGLPVLAIYALLRVFELTAAPSSPSAEAHADLWGLSGVEADGVGRAKLDRVIQLHRRFLETRDPEGGKERLEFIQNWRKSRRQEQEEQIAEWQEKYGPGGVVPYAVEKEILQGFEEGLSNADNLQAGGPGGIGYWRFGSMLLTSIVATIMLGIALPGMAIITARFGWCALAMIGLVYAARAVARTPFTLKPNSQALNYDR